MAKQPLNQIPVSLLREGRAMLNALASDWSRLHGWDVMVSWDSKFGALDIPGVAVHSIDAGLNFLDAWRAIADEVDFVVVIAPEIDNQLIDVIEALRGSNAILLNADSHFLRAASDLRSRLQPV